MPSRVVVDDDEQIIADLLKRVRRLETRQTTTRPYGTRDEFTVAATPETEYQLTYIPVSGTCAMYVNGLEQEEDTDYTVDYDEASATVGLVTFVTGLMTGDTINFRYLVTDWLVARSLPEDTGAITDNFNRADSSTSPNPASDGGTWTVPRTTMGITSNRLRCVVADTGWSGWTAAGLDGYTGPAVLRDDLGSVAQDVTVTIGKSGTARNSRIFFNYTDNGTNLRSGYTLRTDGSSSTLRRTVIAGGTTTHTTLATSFLSAFTGAGSSVIRVRHNGAGAIDVYQDGSLVTSVTDGTPLTGTGVGLANDQSDGTDWFDDFSALPS